MNKLVGQVLYKSRNVGCFVPFLVLLIMGLISCNQKEVETFSFPLSKQYNIDEDMLVQAYSKMAQIDGALSLIVCKDGVNVAERFYRCRGSGKESLNSIMSVTKSYIGILVGIAIDKGYINNVNDPIGQYLNGLVKFTDDSKSKITIGQLLKMSSGHEWNGTNSSSLYMTWVNSKDELQYIIDLPLTTIPGTVFNYSDGASHLLSVIISKATSMNTADFAKKYLFDPLGYGRFEWFKDSKGYPNGAAGLSVKPGDFTKLGILILNKGLYNGNRIVSESWIDEMTTAKISTFNNVMYGQEYGYQIWIGSSGGLKHIMAMGWGGQFVFIVPDKKLVVSATCWNSGLNWMDAGEHWVSIANIVVNDIFPSVK